MTQDQGGTDLRHYLQALWRRKFVFFACIVLIPAAVYALSVRLPKSYQASATIEVGAGAVDMTLFPGQAPQPTGQIAQTVRLMQTRAVAREAAKHLANPPADPASLLGQLQITGDADTQLVTISATDSSAARAAAIANAWTRAVVVKRKDSAVLRVTTAITGLEEQLAGLPRSDHQGRRQLSDQLQRFRALRAAQGTDTSVVEAATAPGSPISPHPRRNAELAAIVAVLLGFALVSSIDRMDRRIRRPNEIEQLVGAPLLAVVPDEAFPGHAPSSSVREAFQTLRTSLTYFNIDEPLSRVLVTSAMKSDGKTTTATNLAVAAARGGKRVIIVDADLRKPAVASRMGIEQPRFGLSDVLVGERSAEDALVPVDVGGNGSLSVLPAGTIPPNPSELIGSQRLRAVLDEVAGYADLVIIDSPPVLPVSDAIPLLDQSSGVVIVARVNRTHRDALARLSQVVAAAGGKVLGVVATGASGAGLQEEGGYSYAGGYGYAASGRNGRSNGNGPTDAELQPGAVSRSHAVRKLFRTRRRLSRR